MFRWLRQKFCKHDFHYAHSYKADVDESVGYDLREVFNLYCPKCRKQKQVLEHEYKTIMARQEIDKGYEQTKDRNNPNTTK